MAALDAQTLESILSFQTEISRASDSLEDLVNLVVRRTAELTGTDGAVLEIQEGDYLVYRAVSGLAKNQLGLRVSFQHSLSGLAVQSGAPQICEDSEVDSRVDREACRQTGLRSMVVYPLRFDSSAVGVLKVMSRVPGAVGLREQEIIQRFADLVGILFHKASEWARLQQENHTLQHLSSHDALTGLRNRSGFHEQLRLALVSTRRTGRKLGTVLFDLDGLKDVNDTYGHQAGDTLIKTFGRRLRDSLRETDTAARLGGDEFGVLLPDLPDASQAQGLSSELAQRAEGPLQIGSATVQVRTSFGVAVAPDQGIDPEFLLGQADEELYRHKRSRKAPLN